MEARKITFAEVARHNKAGDLWAIFDDWVYDVSNFDYHPGGDDKLFKAAGHDATEMFKGHSTDALRMREEFKIGKLWKEPETEFTMAEVSKHDSEGDRWIVIEGKVIDVSNF